MSELEITIGILYLLGYFMSLSMVGTKFIKSYPILSLSIILIWPLFALVILIEFVVSDVKERKIAIRSQKVLEIFNKVKILSDKFWPDSKEIIMDYKYHESKAVIDKYNKFVNAHEVSDIDIQDAKETVTPVLKLFNRIHSGKWSKKKFSKKYYE